MRRDDKPPALPPKAFDVLLTLIENKGRLVEKGELFASVWQNQDDCADKRRRTGKIVRRSADLQFRRLDSVVARRTFYQLPRLGKRRLVAPPVDGGATKLLEGLPPEKLYQFDWSPDGKQFAFTRGREVREVVLIENFK